MPECWTFMLLGRRAVQGYTLLDSGDFERFGRIGWRMARRPRTAYVMSTRHPRVLLHREILGLSQRDSVQVDHINHDGLDNRRCNLRIVSSAENGQNREGAQRGRDLPRGVYRCGQKFQAKVHVAGKGHHLGVFPTTEEAESAAQAFRREYMPYSEMDKTGVAV